MKRSRLTRKLDAVREEMLNFETKDGLRVHKIVSDDSAVYIFEKRPPEEERQSDGEDGSDGEVNDTDAPAAAPAANPVASRTTRRKAYRAQAMHELRVRRQLGRLPTSGAAVFAAADDALSDDDDNGGAASVDSLSFDSASEAPLSPLSDTAPAASPTLAAPQSPPLLAVTAPAAPVLPEPDDVQEPDVQEPDVQEPDVHEPDVHEPDVQEPDVIVKELDLEPTPPPAGGEAQAPALREKHVSEQLPLKAESPKVAPQPSQRPSPPHLHKSPPQVAESSFVPQHPEPDNDSEDLEALTPPLVDVTGIAGPAPVTQATTLSAPRAPSPLVPGFDDEDLTAPERRREAAEVLAVEQEVLAQDARHVARATAEITHEMLQEAQQLLQLFGLPFIIAPMEAEAQCAALEQLGLTQGTITDDSDVLLFGGQNVYRRVCSRAKAPEFYRAADIESYLGLDRDKLIQLAYLLGCDYTPGIPGVGVVLAMEMLVDFAGSGQEQLLALRDWLDHMRDRTLAYDESESKLRRHLRHMKRPLVLPDGFPDPRVRQAFRKPEVDPSNEPFTWASLDTAGLHDFAFLKLGWSRDQVDHYLQPVLTRPTRPAGQQLRIDEMLSRSIQPQKGLPTLGADRLKKARQKLLAGPRAADAETSPPPKRRKLSSPAKQAQNDVDASTAAATEAAPRKRKRPSAKAIPRPKAVPAYQLWLQAAHKDLGTVRPSEAWKALSPAERQQWQDQAAALREAAAQDDDDDE